MKQSHKEILACLEFNGAMIVRSYSGMAYDLRFSSPLIPVGRRKIHKRTVNEMVKLGLLDNQLHPIKAKP